MRDEIGPFEVLAEVDMNKESDLLNNIQYKDEDVEETEEETEET